jgi:hypothetical protein
MVVIVGGSRAPCKMDMAKLEPGRLHYGRYWTAADWMRELMDRRCDGLSSCIGQRELNADGNKQTGLHSSMTLSEASIPVSPPHANMRMPADSMQTRHSQHDRRRRRQQGITSQVSVSSRLVLGRNRDAQ